MSTTLTEGRTALLHAMANLTEYHREHEKFYGAAPREQAATLQRHARTLQALADRWSTVEPAHLLGLVLRNRSASFPEPALRPK